MRRQVSLHRVGGSSRNQGVRLATCQPVAGSSAPSVTVPCVCVCVRESACVLVARFPSGERETRLCELDIASHESESATEMRMQRQ